MTQQQALSFALVGVTVILFIWGRWRYDLIALGALAAGLAIGVIPVKSAFAGLSNDIVIIIASALVLSSAVARSPNTSGAPLLSAAMRVCASRLAKVAWRSDTWCAPASTTATETMAMAHVVVTSQLTLSRKVRKRSNGSFIDGPRGSAPASALSRSG